ncbi:MAG: peptide ABC transporter substrate-binding protein [Chloroflexi bacterium]|uniref:peptide ABC transporter substrate-binding protein n=1 Tax=Candidatus Flexifilum breve TaxID=3140694 RepID=UPI0031370813|nr:peptide ABC transporter substrate-binding protein [Chloroflexota bacterium]
MVKRASLVLVILLVLSVTSVLLVSAQEGNQDIYGRDLPEDAAPYEMQTWSVLCDSTRTEMSLSSIITVYQRICGDTNIFDLLGDALVNLDENLNLIPGAAESWEPTEDGTAWLFHLRPGQVWSDGTPLTAADYVASFRFMADPANAYDFVWMWQGTIKNWSEAVAGEVSPEDVGVEAVDDLTVKVTTDGARPYLPGMVYFWPPLQAAALAEHGPGYVIDPALSVSSGPFMLTEFEAGSRLTLEANPTYTGYRPPYIRQITATYGDQLNGSFLAFQNHQIDRVMYVHLSPADFEVIASDPILAENYLPNFGDFRTDYLFFDTYTAPFDNLQVRQAFAHALDRESIVENVIGSQFGVPAYSFLAPGFPSSDATGDLREYQNYDCELAQSLLAEAGYPGGEGFPAQELKLRGETEARAQWWIASAASISDCLNVEITVNNMEFNAFMEALLARPTGITFGAVSYGMDYLDPSNMLGVWVSTARHSWRSAEFDQLVNDANVLVGDLETRDQMYRDAERILVEEAAGVFLVHRIQGDLFQPYVAGECFRPDAQGVSAWHWGNDWCWGTFYITNDVANYDTYRD